jgi:predicted dehydrogenase
MIQLALLGAAHIHAPGIARTLLGRGDLRVKSVYDHDAARAARYATQLSAQPSADLHAVLADREISAVLIYSETARHEELVLSAAKAKKHLFVEKPLGLGHADSSRMARAIERCGVLFQTGFFNRSSPVHRFLKSEIEQGRFGQVTRIRAANGHAAALEGWFDQEHRWMTDPEQAGHGALADLGIHMLDILIWLVGPVQSCLALTSPGTGRYEPTDEVGESLLLFRGGALGSLCGSWDDLACPLSLEISGTTAHAAVISGQLHYTNKAVPGADGAKPWTALPEPAPRALELFLDAVTGKPHPHVPLVSAREAAYRSAVVEAIYKSAHTGRRAAPKSDRARRPRPGAAPAPSV